MITIILRFLGIVANLESFNEESRGQRGKCGRFTSLFTRSASGLGYWIHFKLCSRQWTLQNMTLTMRLSLTTKNVRPSHDLTCWNCKQLNISSKVDILVISHREEFDLGKNKNIDLKKIIPEQIREIERKDTSAWL